MTEYDVMVAYQKLLTEWKTAKPNLDTVGRLLSQLKVLLTQVSFLPTSNSNVSKQELIVARDVLEIGAQHSVLRRDIVSFERYLAQLKCYYFDYKDEFPESAYMYQLLGLNLLSLLAQNRLADFHTELELLPPKELQNNIYIKHPVSLEQWLMEGSYNKVFLSKDNVPAHTYTYFIDILLDTIRVEIADCIEKAYENINVTEASRMLFYTKPQEMATFAEKRNWQVNSTQDQFIFITQEQKESKTNGHHIPAEMLASKTIEYARELEMIV